MSHTNDLEIAAVTDGGFAMIVAVILLSVVMSLSLIIVTNADHLDSSTVKARSSSQALQVAESGINVAIAKLRLDPNTVPNGSQVGSTSEGSYSYTVSKNGQIYTLQSTGTVSSGRTGGKRTVAVTLMGPSLFQYAILSKDQISLTDNTTINGGLWSNNTISLGDNMHINGPVISATGSLKTTSNTWIVGDVWTGGFDGTTGKAVALSGTTVTGNVTASPSDCSSANPTKYVVSGSGSISGKVKTFSSTGVSPLPAGGSTLNACTTAPVPQEIPLYAWNAANYADPHEFTIAQWDTWLAANKTNVKGAFHITNGGDRSWVNLKGATITGDFVLMTDVAPIEINTLSFSPSSKIIVIGSRFSPPSNAACQDGEFQSDQATPCAIGVRDGVNVPASTAMLVYAPNGPIAMRDNTGIRGAIYGEGVKLTDNILVTFDSRVQTAVGFGDVALTQTKWVELPG